jgi:hypothetical protein
MTGRDDLEKRLADRLERRAPMPPQGLLEDLLLQTSELPQRRRGLAFASTGWWALGVAVAAALLIGAVALRTSLLPPSTGPGSQATPSASATPAETTIILPMPVREKAIAEQAEAVFQDRLRALGVGTFSGSIGDDIRFTLVIPETVDPADVELVLHTFGQVEWLAWPDALSYPAEGDVVPDGVLPLFDAANQIVSVQLITTQNAPPGPGVEVTFGPTAMEALAAYTSSHVGKPMPLAMDGTILTSPTIQGAITGGDLVISFASQGGSMSAAALAAILESGPLPTGWTVE